MADLSEGPLIQTIIKTSVPTMVAFLLHSAFNIADAIFLGWISAEALAAVSISFPIVFLMIALGSGIGVGATSVVARYIGSKQEKKASIAAEHGILSALVIGVVLSICGILMAPYMFRMMGADPGLEDLAISYINIILVFSPLMLTAMVANSILRGEGDMTTPMKVMAAGALLNIVLDPLFIFTLKLGVEGAAYATVLSRTIAFIYLFWHMLSGRSQVRIKPFEFTYEAAHIKDIFLVSIPSSISNVLMSFGMFMFNVIVGAYGVEALAAFGIGFRLDSIALLPAMGIMMSTLAIVGQSLGAKKRERAREATVKGGLLAIGFMVMIGILFFAFAPQIVSIFNADPLVKKYAVSFLRTIPFTYLVVGMAMCITGAFLGAGKAMYALFVTGLRVLVFSVPLAYLGSSMMGIQGIWWGIVIGTYLAAFASVLLFYFTEWDRLEPTP